MSKAIVKRPQRIEPNSEPCKFKSKSSLISEYTVIELKSHCKRLKIKGYSKLKEEEIAELIYNKLKDA